MLVSEKSIMMWIASRLEVQRDDAYYQSMFIKHEMIDKESSTHSRKTRATAFILSGVHPSICEVREMLKALQSDYINLWYLTLYGTTDSSIQPCMMNRRRSSLQVVVQCRRAYMSVP